MQGNMRLCSGLEGGVGDWVEGMIGLSRTGFREGTGGGGLLYVSRVQEEAACGIKPRTDATLLGCLFLCCVFFHSFAFFFSVYLLPCQVLRTNLRRETRKLLGPRRTVCNGQFAIH